MFRFVALMLLTCFAMPVAYASDAVEKGTRIHLSATAEQVFPNNELSIHFYFEARGKQASALRAQVNSSSKALEKGLAKVAGIRTRQTNDRQLTPLWHYNKTTQQQQRDGWMLQQRETLVCDPDKGAVIVEVIEAQGVVIDSLNFSIDRLSQQRHRQQLEQQAIKDFRQRAASFAASFAADHFQIIDIQTENSIATPRPQMKHAMARSMMADAPAPTAAMHSGDQRMQERIRGTILLPPHDFSSAP